MSSKRCLYNNGCADDREGAHSIRPIVCPNVATDGTDGNGVDEEGQNQNDESHIEDQLDHQYVDPHQPSIPQEPSVDEYLKHQINHFPFKPWCPICMKNQAV